MEVNPFTNDLMIQAHHSPVEALRTVFDAHIWVYITEFYISTRSYEDGLILANDLLETISLRRREITPAEYKQWEAAFIVFKLALLDRLNRWGEYLEVFEAAPHTAAMERVRYGLSRRKDIIQRKYDRWREGKSVDHLRRHQQEGLSAEDMQRRMADITRRLEIEYRRMKDRAGI